MTVVIIIGIIMTMENIFGGDAMDFSNFLILILVLKLLQRVSLDLLIVWYVLYLLITVFKEQNNSIT